MSAVPDIAACPADLARWDRRHVLHPWADLATLGEADPFLVTGAQGCRVFDSRGREYLDAIGGMWCMTLGHGRRELIEAMQEQASRMSYYSPFASLANAPACTLARELAQLAPGDLQRVHFTTGGSTAVESAIRIAHYYFRRIGQKARRHVLSRVDAYHGSTYLAASASGKRRDRTCFDYEHSFVHLLSSPNPYRRPAGRSIRGFCDALVQELEDRILALGPEQVACFLAEPILASGGVIVPPEGYVCRTREICAKYGVLYVCDEVVTGFGRLGHFFASAPHFDIIPDMLVCAKGLTSGYQPLGAVLVSDRLVDAISGRNAAPNSTFTNGFTYSGHPVACAVAVRNIQIMRAERICEHVRAVGPYFMRRLRELRRFAIVGEVRGDHLMACIELTADDTAPDSTGPRDCDIAVARRVDRYCETLGLLVRPYESMCILSPPLIIGHAEIDRICAILARAIELTQRDLALEGKLRGCDSSG